MKKFFIKISLFLLLQLCIGIVLLFWLDRKDASLSYPQGKTESAVLSIPENKNVDLLIMGSSHARVFSRGSNHQTVEQILGMSVVNIGKSGAGIVPEKLLLNYFYAKGNKAKVILYFIDPFIFYTRKWNEELYFLSDEPFRIDFFPRVLFSSLNPDVKFEYIKSKFKDDWKNFNASRVPAEIGDSLTFRDTADVRKRIESFLNQNDTDLFNYYASQVEAVVDKAMAENSKIIFIIPPTLLGRYPGMDYLVSVLKKLKSEKGIPYYDHSMLILDPKMYYNHDHLNHKGVAYYVNNFLANLIRTAR